jgi:hypothetical protein
MTSPIFSSWKLLFVELVCSKIYGIWLQWWNVRVLFKVAVGIVEFSTIWIDIWKDWKFLLDPEVNRHTQWIPRNWNCFSDDRHNIIHCIINTRSRRNFSASSLRQSFIVCNVIASFFNINFVSYQIFMTFQNLYKCKEKFLW